MPTVRKLKFRNQAEGEKRLLLYWEAAQPLKQVLADLPPLGSGFPLSMKLTAPAAAGFRPQTLEELACTAGSSELTVTLPSLPEPLFERLALRFRPFYAQKEATNFLALLKMLADMNEDLRAHRDHLKERWQRAVFFGAMGMPNTTPPVDAEQLIMAGFYSRYFHLSDEARDLADRYEAAMGKDMFKAAVVSSVWQHSKLVLGLADELERYLVETELLPEEAPAAFRDGYRSPSTTVTLSLEGGVGAIQLVERKGQGSCE
jgi:hypothetical protein